MVKAFNVTEDSNGQDILVKVLMHIVRFDGEILRDDSNSVAHIKCADVLIGDETGCLFFFAVDEQVDIMKPGCTVFIRNFEIEIADECFRLRVNNWGSVVCVEPGLTTVDTHKNFSIINYDNFLSHYCLHNAQ